jgi:2-succinyl-5-enolpyruvyl-6-hydroxy-3-cyclohexene-1-carboxylate synthase
MKRNQHIADLGPLLAGHGIRHVVICPGNRNAPLIQLFTGNPSFHCHSIVDERSAGYLALGMARQLQQPVGVVTTSGTAVLNLAPAVAEAHYQHIPLIVFTADRPLEPIPQCNNQVIDQTEPFAGNSKGFYHLPQAISGEDGLQEMLRRVEALVREACTAPGGPVHCNVLLSEPLYEPLPDPYFSHFTPPGKRTVHEAVPAAKRRIPAGTRILVLAGMGRYSDRVRVLLETLAERRRAVVVAENIANLPSDRFIANPELLLHAAGENGLEELRPDLVVAFGGQVVSKRLKLFLEAYPPGEIRILEKNPEEALEGMLESGGDNSGPGPGKRNAAPGKPAAGGGTPFTRGPSPAGYLGAWKSVERKALSKATGYLGTAPYGNLSVIYRTLRSVPRDTVLHLGNSAIIRYSQLLPLRRDLCYYSNRGTSGIDGTVSAAVGAAMVSGGMHLLVVGDLAFVYDSNALWNKDFPDNLKIVVVNDQGGGIFRLLEGPDRMPFFEEFSVTHHPVSLEMLCHAFGRGFLKAEGPEALEEQLEILLKPGAGVTVLEADTSGTENSRIFKEFLNHCHS